MSSHLLFVFCVSLSILLSIRFNKTNLCLKAATRFFFFFFVIQQNSSV